MGLFTRKNNNHNSNIEERSFFPYVQQTYGSGLLNGELNLAVDNACSKISNTISILPLRLLVWSKTGQVEAWNHPVAKLLRDPAVEESAQCFYKTIVRHLLLKGNAYIYKHKSGNQVIALEIIAPEKVTQVKRNELGKKLFYIGESQNLIYTEDDVIHIFFPEEGYNGTIGRSPVDIHRDIILKNTLISEYVSLFFKNGMNSRLLVTLGEEFKPGNPKMEKIVQEFQAYMNTFVLGFSNAGKPIVTPPGTSISKMEMGSNVQSDVLNLYKQSCAEVYRIFNIPPEVLDSSESKYGSLEAKQQDFLITCIRPLCMNITQLLAKGLLKPNEQGLYEISYDYNAMLEVDVSKKADYLLKLYHGGLLTLNEFRQRMSMGTVENEVEGNTRLIPANFLPWTEENIKSILAKSKLALQEAETLQVEKQEEKQNNHHPINDKLQ